ncbi:C-type mannose receptor 2-like [Acanthaster planci]|uniref:C-type mannose receptor 2-like n=1 Tax=Acanthaster planci TaxID=133434 RepID=A0A8B7ZXW9_ACAPL|nr:C-type mannose receptor 2-like [Acanthaster planci]
MLVQAPASNVWIGLNDRTVEGVYRWADGTPLTGFTNWGPNQPDNGNKAFQEDCMYLRANENFPGEWYDGYCDYPRAYICEKPQDPSIPVDPPSFPCYVELDPTYIIYVRACYKLESSTTRSYQDAVSFCENDHEGVRITWIEDAFQEAFLQAMLFNAGINSAWIGLETLRGINNLKWQGREALTYTNWAKNQPQDTTRCGILTTEGWKDEDCNAKHPVLCRQNLGRRPSVPPTFPGSVCPAGMVEIDDQDCAVGINSTFATSWEEAQEICKAYDSSSSLPSVHTLNEDNNLAGLFYTDPDLEVWIGLSPSDRDQYQWVDGSLLDYVNFGSNTPGDGCGVMVISPGSGQINVEWKTADCNENRGFICRAPKVYTPPSKGGCLPGWYQLGIRCYRSVGLLDADRRDFSDSDEYCREEGGGRGRLFQVTSQLEQSLLSLLLQEFVNKTNLWIGLSDANEEGQFVWTDGTPMTFSQWAPFQPDGFTDIPNEPFRDCVEVRTDPQHLGEWDDINCLERRGYICQTFLDLDSNSTNVVIPEMCANRPGYSKYKDSCYKLVDQMLSFADAQNFCSQEGAWLATSRDGFYNAALSLLVNWYSPTPEYVWIGLDQASRRLTAIIIAKLIALTTAQWKG